MFLLPADSADSADRADVVYTETPCTASNAHVRLQFIEYLNISGLVIDFATSPVRTGNSFFE